MLKKIEFKNQTVLIYADNGIVTIEAPEKMTGRQLIKIKAEVAQIRAEFIETVPEVASIEVKRKMRTQRVRFTFKKANGAIRKAYGTTCQKFFKYASKGGNKRPNQSVVNFYDLVKCVWRSFRIDSLIINA